ncbi:TIM barrel protein [Clostridium sp. AM58-1XD]|uniref:sugar phosphate isomerase/epimerase family protein n=1 Tax=Clostridium sp. AM58-1XD TaxID=2292307 RepID=UPI000E4936AA|nr:TIM barrel protein [Clostridium sp. AM58-1XD]RGY99256.1 sugar phosphate isomerase/epimerase [Clostridium sp. AM58-1XD]
MKKTKIGISSYSYSYAVGFPGFTPPSPLDAFGLVDKAAELEVPVLQIGDNCPLDGLGQERLAALGDYAKRRGISIEVGTRGIKTDNLLRYIQIAAALHAPLLRVVLDTKDSRPDFDEIIQLLRCVLPELEKTDIVLGIENHDRFPARVFAQIVKTLDHPNVGIVLDTVNSFACEETTWQVVDELAKYTVNFHVKDFKIQRVENSMGCW